MTRKLSTALILALILVLTTSAVVFAQGTAPQDGTGYRHGWTDNDRGMNRGTGMPAGAGENYVDADNDGVCDNFVDEDDDGVCDNCDQDGSGQMMRRGAQNQDGAADSGSMRRGRQGRQGGQGRNR